MANKYRGEALLKTDDQEFTLVFDCNAMCALEDVLSMSFVEFARKTANGTLGFKGARALLWVGMLARHRSTTVEKCGEIINEVGIKAAIETCWGALKHVFPAEPEPGNSEAAPGTGTSS